ncbi:MAG TPA: DUF4136 domain-containing protein [Terriglobia bacterium]|nr:DUF4136 domain-containing protein [Terriglobia bacterium]
MRLGGITVGLILFSLLVLADDHNVDFDSHTDFSKFKTFSIGAGIINSRRPELKNSLVVSKIQDAIRTAFVARKMMEAKETEHPDTIATFTVDGQDYSVGPGGRANPIRGGRGDRGGRGGSTDSPSSQQVDFTEGTLVIDVNTTATPPLLVWRGVYHDTEKSDAKLAQKLPDDAKKLLSEFPSKGK